jgi:type IV secretory pathway TraG/TraD family ATPase VirD4
MNYSRNNLTYFAESNRYSRRILFGIKQEDRLLHTYIIGKTGTGKTNLLQTHIIQDISFGRGFCVIDIHGDLINKIFSNIPKRREEDVIYLDITNPDHNFKFNPFIKVPYEKRPLIASGILDVFEKLWKSAWGLKLEHILRYILLTLLDQEEANISDIIKILDDEGYRDRCVRNVVNDDIKRFWQKEFKVYTKGDLLPIYNKVGAFLVYPAIRRLLIENTDEISFRKIMDSRKILLINISKGSLGENVSSILGSLILNSLSFSAFSRIDIHESNRVPFFVYLDEFQNYTTLSLVNMLSELRKFKLALIMAHQYLAQLTDEIRDAVLGNVGTVISFRLGVADASYFAKEYYPVFDIVDIINLSNYEIYLKLMIDGTPSEPFSATTIKWLK